MKPWAAFVNSKPLYSQIRNVFLPEVFTKGTFESFNLPNSNQFVSQYSRRLPNGRAVFGLGTSANQQLSQIKAYAEFVERKAFLESSKELQLSSTNGIATHILELIAEKNAKDELFERDSFLMHWFSETPMYAVDSERSYLSEEIKLTLQLGYLTRFYETFLGYQKTTVCFLISNRTGGFCIGLSSGRGRKGDLQKSFLEASINLFLCEDGDNPASFSTTDEFKLKHHRDFWLFEQTLPKWVLLSPQLIEEVRPKPVFEKFILPSEHFSTVAVKSENLLVLSVGSASARDIELVEKRLNKNNVTINLSKNLIHPIP